MNDTSPSGLDLKVERIRARVKAGDLAEQMGVTRSRITTIEREAFPSEDAVRRYREGLQKCQNVPAVAA